LWNGFALLILSSKKKFAGKMVKLVTMVKMVKMVTAVKLVILLNVQSVAAPVTQHPAQRGLEG
jgi:hypothetical protein